MVRACCVTGCKNVWHPNCDISFYRLPLNDQNLLERWIQVIPTKYTISKCTNICSDHFSNASFAYKNGRRFLNKDAIPTIFQITSQPETSGTNLLAKSPGESTPLQPSSAKRLQENTEPSTSNFDILRDITAIAADSDDCTSTKQLKAMTKPTALETTEICNVEREMQISPVPAEAKKDAGTQVSPRRLPPTETEENLRKKIRILRSKLHRRDKRISTITELLTKLRNKGSTRMALDHVMYCRTNPKMLEVDANIDSEVELQNDEHQNFDEILIDAVKCYPHLYDTGSKDYRDAMKKENCWVEISKVTNMPPDACCNRWNRLRESFSKEKKKRLRESKTGSSASKRRGFGHFESMKFIDKFVKSRSTVSHINFKKKLSHSAYSKANSRREVSKCTPKEKRSLEQETVPLQENNSNVFRPKCKQSEQRTLPTVITFEEASLPSFPSTSENAINIEFIDRSLSVSSSPVTIESPFAFPTIPEPAETVEIMSHATGKFNPEISIKNREKIKDVKNDEFEKAFINLNKAVAEHLKAKQDLEKLPNDPETSFCNLILAEMRTMGEEEKCLKKQEILKILWRKTNP